MKLGFQRIFAAAWHRLQRDRELLLPLAGLAMFLPQYALMLLVPAVPSLPVETGEAALTTWAQAVSEWGGRYGLWYLLAPGLGLYGTLTVASLYFGPGRTLAEALRNAVGLFPRYLLASILVAMPTGVVLMPLMAAPVLIVALLPPLFYVFGRTMLVAPIIVAERPIGAVQAIIRSWEQTRGNGWVLAGVYGVTAITAQLLGGLLGRVALSAGGSAETANPVIEALLGGIAALVAAGSALLLILIEVAVYRALASKGN